MSRFAWVAVLLASSAWAKPPAGGVFCVKYPTAPMCVGQQPSCSLCHVAPPQRNAFGASLESHLTPGAPRPLSDGDFAAALPAALAAVEGQDADGDGASNLTEFQKGTFPGDAKSAPATGPCVGGENPQYRVCQFDERYMAKKLVLDFCGVSPTYAELKNFDALPTVAEKLALADSVLDQCLAGEFWRGKNGQLWRLAHPKVRPVGSLKEGAEQGAVPLADYDDDYNLFTYAHTDDHDARELLTANYYVRRLDNPTRYEKVASLGSQNVDVAHRAGMLTTKWNLVYFVMFTALPRNAASQAYRGYLGLDIAKQEGLFSVANEPRDYDAKGVQATACAACHATLDPLSYPFRNYHGIGGPTASYVPRRIETFFANQAPTISQIPEQGVIFGQPVANLVEWANVAANSDAFARATVADYWKLLIGHAPTPEENAEFNAVWQHFKTTHNYRVKPMLHELIRTEAYGAP